MSEDTELSELETFIAQLQRGELTRPEFRGHTVHYGVYTQRQTDRYFVRVRIPNGMISPDQLIALASAAETWGKGECHLTTRQGVEIHELLLEHVLPVLRVLAEADLSSHEAGGNTVRGIMVCPHAGAWPDEPFDVTSYADLLNRHFLRHPDYQRLPRKVKIGFSCCEEDCAQTQLQDLGFQACAKAVEGPGFRVLVGGGMGSLPRLGQVLLDFLPADQVLPFTDAFLRMFNRLGDRKNRGRARVKFLVQSLGSERFRQEILDEWGRLKQQKLAYPERRLATDRPNFPPEVDSVAKKTLDAMQESDPEFADWVSVQVQSRPTHGFSAIRVSLAGGFATSSQLRQLAALAQLHGLAVRTSPEQGFLLRWARPAHLFPIYQGLAKAKLHHPRGACRLVACPGSSTCSNGFTNTRALAGVLSAQLDCVEAAKSVAGQWRIKISGCPNGCALHRIADVGLEGLASRNGSDWVPAYRLWVGGQINQRQTRLASDLGMIPAAKVPECLADLMAHFNQGRKSGESLTDWVERLGVQSVKALLQKHHLALKEDRQALMIDWGESVIYRPPDKGRSQVC